MTPNADDLAVGPIQQALASIGQRRLVLQVTLLLLLLHGSNVEYAEVPIRILCGAALIAPGLLLNRLLWWTLSAACAIGTASEWYLADNHKFLITYWTIACALSLSADVPQRFLSRTASILLALVFTSAVVWKIAGGQFLDGSFLYVTFLTDSRLQRLGASLAGWEISESSSTANAIRFLSSRNLTETMVVVPQSASLKTAALVLSWAGLAVESAVAVLYWLPRSRGYVLRNYALMGFIALTYFLLPVLGFAFVLCVIGLAQCHEADTKTQSQYLAVLSAIQLATIPWQSFLPKIG